MKYIEVQCIICGSKLEKEELNKENMNPKTIGIVYDGVIFRASGNYGSSVFDPFPDNGFAEIIICDKCMVEKKDKILRVKNIKCNSTYTSDISNFEPYKPPVCGPKNEN